VVPGLHGARLPCLALGHPSQQSHCMENEPSLEAKRKAPAVSAGLRSNAYRMVTADRDAFQRYVCHTWKRMSCQTPGIRRGSEVERRG
jgi:hypothetical protein